MFNAEFIKSTTELLGDEAPLLIEALRSESPTSIRYNPYKIDAAPAGKRIPWCTYGRYLAERPQFTLDPKFHGGQYYVQEASSMFVEHLFRSAIGEATDGLRVLDLCAAPGGKSTLYSTLAGLEGLVVANEVIRSRAATLTDNIRKWGLGNVVVTNNEAAHFGALREWFDVVAVDAPCSGEGMFRKSAEAREQWSLDNVKLCAARQKKILGDIWDSLVPGGVLIYSTCTFNRQENEDNIEWLAENFECEDAGIEAPAEWGITQTEAAGIKCFRFYPHKVEGEGFFACAIRKGGQKGRPMHPKARKSVFSDLSKPLVAEIGKWVAQPEFMRFAQVGDNVYGYYDAAFRDIKAVSESMNAIYSGICIGQLFNGKLKPDPALALFHDVSRKVCPAVNIDINDALQFLRKENLADISVLSEGINLVMFEDTPLGWAKRIGNRLNNLYPKSLMINSK